MTLTRNARGYLPPVIDLRLQSGGRQARFTNRIDEDTLKFEEELSRDVDLSLPQRQCFLAAGQKEFRLFQMRDANGRPAMQIALSIHRPSRLKKMGRAIANRMGPATHLSEELEAIRWLREICTASGDLITLRLQSIRLDSAGLDAFESNARSAGFEPTAPLSYTRTLKCSLEGSPEDILMRMSKKTRPKLRRRTRSEMELRPLNKPEDLKHLHQCKAALKASFERTGGDANEYDFEAAFELAQTHPERVVIFGIFLPSRPELLLAFVIGRYGGGQLAEYSSAGSLADAELRKMPFNYFLVWELIQWAHAQGARWLDLGGITPGGPDDPRASISEFKRHLCENEVEISRELVCRLQPVRAFLFDRLNALRRAASAPLLKPRKSPKPSTRLAAGTVSATALFALLALGLRLAGSPGNPALVQFAKQSHAPALAIVGDSRAHVGISPTTLTLELGMRGLTGIDSYNYAVDGSDVLHHYSFVSHSIDAVTSLPRVVIWTPNPLQFNEARQSNRLEMLLPSDIPGLYRAGAPLEMLLDLATMAVFPPMRERPLVKHQIFEDYGGRAEIRTLPLQERLLGLHAVQAPLSREYHAAGDGQVPFTVLDWPDRFKRGSDAYVQDYKTLKLSDWHFRLARELMRKVRESGSLLIVLETPVAPFFQRNIEPTAKHQEWRTRLQKIAAEEGAIFWSHADHYQDDHLFGDPGHMPESTALDYSRFLATQLATDPQVRAALERHHRI